MENKQQQNKNKIVASPIVEPPPNKKTRQTNQLKFLTSSVLRLLVTHKDAWPFSRPINPKEIRIANYYEIIKTPMDLLSIRYRLKNNYYWSAKEAIDDFNLIFENAYKISKPDNLFHQYADNLKKYFLKLLEAMPSEEYEIGTNNENASGDKVKTSQIKAKRITKRRDTLPARVTESKVRISMDEDETEEKYDDEKSASDAEKSPDPVDFAENLKDRLDNLQNSLKMFQKTFTAQLTGLKSMVSDDAINDPVSNGNPIGPQQMNGICKKTSGNIFRIYFL